MSLCIWNRFDSIISALTLFFFTSFALFSAWLMISISGVMSRVCVLFLSVYVTRQKKIKKKIKIKNNNNKWTVMNSNKMYFDFGKETFMEFIIERKGISMTKCFVYNNNMIKYKMFQFSCTKSINFDTRKKKLIFLRSILLTFSKKKKKGSALTSDNNQYKTVLQIQILWLIISPVVVLRK